MESLGSSQCQRLNLIFDKSGKLAERDDKQSRFDLGGVILARSTSAYDTRLARLFMPPYAKLSTIVSLLALLLLSVESAHAEWVMVSGNDEKRFIIYANSDSIRRNGELVKMWELWDYALEQIYLGHPYLSLKRQAEYDCKGKQARKLSVTTYTGNMGNGTVGFHSNKEEPWSPVAPETINGELWEYACRKKSR